MPTEKAHQVAGREATRSEINQLAGAVLLEFGTDW
jgi:hypothetical protein